MSGDEKGDDHAFAAMRPRVKLPPRESNMKECTACSEKHYVVDLIELQCSNTYCRSCLEKLFELSMKDETMYPPRCCGQHVSLEIAQKKLSSALVKRFKAKQLELSTKNKTYCYRPTCSNFIAPQSIHNGQAICQKCRAVTCSRCKNAWHFGPCPSGIDAVFFELVEASKWKRCPVCQRIVERVDGCNHMVCRCGSEFCYGCGGELDSCSCSSGDEEDDDIAPAIFD